MKRHCSRYFCEPSMSRLVSILISDSAAAYRAFAREHGITHEAVNLRAGVRARGAIHLNHVNGWHSRFKRWPTRFHGVASRFI